MYKIFQVIFFLSKTKITSGYKKEQLRKKFFTKRCELSSKNQKHEKITKKDFLNKSEKSTKELKAKILNIGDIIF